MNLVMLFSIRWFALTTCIVAGLMAQSGPSEIRDSRTIGVDDTISITAFACEEISKTWRVGASGYIDLPMVGRVKAAGVTVEELEKELVRRLDRYLKTPSVSVVITEYRSAPVTFSGAVERTGALQLQGLRKLFEGIVMAGGFKQGASAVILTRRAEFGSIPLPDARVTEDGRFWTVRMPASEVQNTRTAAANLELRPNDVIDVEARAPRLIHIIGEVARPGSIELALQSSIPLTKALAVVGGTTRLASMKKVTLRRINDTGASSEIAVIDLKKIIDGKAQDLDLTDGYVVVVPSSDVKSYLQTATMAAVNSSIFSSLQILARF